MKVYLLHFGAGIPRTPRHLIRHYIGATQLPVLERLKRHEEGRGSALVRAAMTRGIAVRVARVWSARTKDDVFRLERTLKRTRNHARYCPFCAPSGKTLLGPRENA